MYHCQWDGKLGCSHSIAFWMCNFYQPRIIWPQICAPKPPYYAPNGRGFFFFFFATPDTFICSVLSLFFFSMSVRAAAESREQSGRLVAWSSLLATGKCICAACVSAACACTSSVAKSIWMEKKCGMFVMISVPGLSVAPKTASSWEFQLCT